LRAAADLVAHLSGVDLVARSPIWETAPLGPPQPAYFNAALLVRTAHTPESLLRELLAVEATLGRERRERWGPRTIDLDILWTEGVALRTDSLTVPHPELTRRNFALAPLLALCPDAVDPTTRIALSESYAKLTNEGLSAPRAFTDAFEGEEIDHTADEGFLVTASGRADLLAAAAEALGALIVDPSSVEPVTRIEVKVEASDASDWGDDERLFAWLAEVLYHLDGGRLALRRAVITRDDPSGIEGFLFGEALDEARHAVRGALKAITWHALEIGPVMDGRWRAQVVVDV
jgi:2-amino-4-hydroxy-6-hydroxymethyldihydropteridine diphosphokinase